MQTFTIIRIERDFAEFDRQNPQVYRHFMIFALEAIRAGHKRIGAKAVMERVRWESAMQTIGSLYKVNNSYVSYYARKFMADFPEHAAIFRTRKVAVDDFR